jgi:DtxR family manganese transport transcriptional regulator
MSIINDKKRKNSYKYLYLGVCMDSIEQKSGERATHFKETRTNRHFEIAEDYTELIADLIENQRYVRICDLAREMGISHVSVLRTIKRLVRDGYIVKNGSSIELTQKGREMAIFSKKKHLILTEFLLLLGVPEPIVATDVEGIEHYISSTTLEAIAVHVQLNFQKNK